MSQISTTNGQRWRVVNKRVLGPTHKQVKLQILFNQYELVHEDKINRWTYDLFQEGSYKVSDGNKIVGYVVNGVAKTVYHLY